MVRAEKVGKARPFHRGLLLTIVTFGIYAIYWRYKAHNELYKQFDMEDEARNDGVIWLILGLVVSFLMFVYDWIFVSNVNALQDRLGLKRRITPLAFILMQVVPTVILVVGYIVIVASAAIASGGTDNGTPDESVLGAGLAVLGVGAVLAIVLAIIAFYRLQTSINDVWGAYDARMQQIRSGGPPAPPAGLPTWASRSPAAPATPPDPPPG